MSTPETRAGRLGAAAEAPIIEGAARKASRAGAVLVLAVGLAATLGACHRGGADWREAQTSPSSAADDDTDYVRPPQAALAVRAADGSLVLSGKAKPGVPVRLASPDGSAYAGASGQDGAWSIQIPPSATVRLFGLSEEIDGRRVQGEGYLATLPAPGRAAVLLRAGGGAAALEGPTAAPEIAAVDFDAGGAAVIAGLARPGQAIKLAIDQAPAAEARADAKGRFTIGLAAMLRSGRHTLTIEQAGVPASVEVDIKPPAPIAGLPYRGAREAGDWRVDWTTPGGGVETTLVVDPPGSPSPPSSLAPSSLAPSSAPPSEPSK